MATALPTHVDTNLETFSIVWLDSSNNGSEEYISAQSHLRTSINYLKIFHQADECEQYIRLISPQDRIILIVSGRLGQEIVPRIHQFSQIFAIYVYCMDKKKNEQWTRSFTKVKDVIVHMNQLVAQIQADQMSRLQNKIDEPFLPSIFLTNADNLPSTMEHNIDFFYSQLFFDCFLRMHSSGKDKKNLLDLCLKEYDGNEIELNFIREFQQNYSPKQALWWYTRKSFLYRLLNKALRMKNIEIIFLFRFFIRDMEQQLVKNKCVSPMRVYRSQWMSNDELELLKVAEGEFISMNSFFSTTDDSRRALAVFQHSNMSKDFVRVLFEIDADPRLDGVKPFANITANSYTPNEPEILFTLGAIFRIVKIRRNNDGLWVIHLELSSENDQRLKAMFEQMKNEYDACGEMDRYSFGDILSNMGKFNTAEKYYRRLLGDLSDDDLAIAQCYQLLGDVNRKAKKHWEAIDYYYKALALRQKHLPVDHPDLGMSYRLIGILHWCAAHDDLALEYFNQALQIFEKSLPPQHLTIGHTLTDIGRTHEAKGDLREALAYFEKAIAVYRQTLPATHPCVINTEQKIQHVLSQLQ